MKGFSHFRQSRLRLTVLYSALIAITLISLAGFFYYMLVHTFEQRTEASLAQAYNRALGYFSKDRIEWMDLRTGERMHFAFSSTLYVDWSFLSNDEFALVTRTGAAPSSGSDVPESFVATLKEWAGEDIASWSLRVPGAASPDYGRFSHTSYEGRTYEMIVASVREYGNQLGYLYMGKDTTDDTRVLGQMRAILLALCGGMLLVAVLLGYLFAGRAMIPIANAYRKLRDFTMDASHELRAPLTVLNASVEIVQEQEERLSPFHQEALRCAKEEIRRMKTLVDHLLTLARSDAGVIELLPERIDVARIVRETAATMRTAAVMQGITLRVREAESSAEAAAAQTVGEVCLTADRERIKQLLVILLDNAIKYNVPGGMIDLFIQPGMDRVTIIVRDSGIGIAAEDLPNIFDRFYRADKSRDRSREGAGLGLSIALWIVNAHGGSLTAGSEIGVGSTFTVQLPVRA
ncbi:HAMP domain-containing histidine kinase [Paenibacillus lycopersici]|uniref:histidine kinase n=1 Tax=Paenibacillus lycopersici TaxID=2704462 RepID=A0A6C0FPE5_9BACL|nr:HAMP domain-containing sensor histidine kinase [Paenibacillus lycopersici]QHT58757.1 HAMP domain-containing histidine kinase [Paenibacillus lycopersici]